MTYRETLFGSSELETVKLLKKDNFWRKVTETYKKPCFFLLLKAWWSDYHLYFKRKSKPRSQLESSRFRNKSVKKCKKRSNENILTQEKYKVSHSRRAKIQSFTFSALTKIHTYCLKVLKSTGDHISLKLWIIRFDLRKKKELLQIRQQKTQFGNSEPQNVNLLNLGKFSKDCSTRKKRKPGKKWIQKAWMSGR